MKIVCNAYYVHKSNLSELLYKLEADPIYPDIIKFFNLIDIEYDVIKYSKGNITLIRSTDWNTANEPLIDYTILFKAGMWFDSEGNIQPGIKCLNGRQIYHNKWMFVQPDYKGFNYTESVERTAIWNSIPDIKKHKSKIGNKTYWIELLKQYDIPV